MVRTCLFTAALLCVAATTASASASTAAFATATNVELPVDSRELLTSDAGLTGLSSHDDVLVVRLRALTASAATATKTDAELREQAQVLFKLYKILNAKDVAAMGATESEQFEVFYKTVFQQILTRVNADTTTPAAATSGPATAAPSTGTTTTTTTAPSSTATPPAAGTTTYSATSTSNPTEIADSLSFFTEVYDDSLAKNVRALQDNTQNIEAIVQSTKTTQSNDPANQFQAPTVLEGVDEGPTDANGRRLAASGSNETFSNVQVMFCDVGGNAIWKWRHTPYDANTLINRTEKVNLIAPTKVCEAPVLEVKVTAYQPGCSRQNHPEGCDNVYWKGCGGLTVNPKSNRIVVARTGGRSLGMLYYKSVSNSCQGRVVDAITTFKGKKFNSISYAEYAPSGNLYFTDSPFGLAKGPADYEGDILDKSPLRELPFNGVFLLKNNSMKVQLVDCAMDRPNKIAFSPKGDVMYITNSRKGNSYVKSFNLTANGEVASFKTFFNFTSHPELQTDLGYADGIKTDSQGNVYVAAYKGIYIFSPKGELIGTLRSNQEVTGIALGGGRMFLTGAFGVVAQSTGIKPAVPLPFAKTECAA